MRTFTVSFFGHRQIEAPFQVESQLEKLISQLLQQNEFVEFLVGREGEFDQLVSSTIRRCKRNIRDDNSALIWVMPYPTAEFRDNESSFLDYYDEIEVCEQAAAAHYKSAFQIRNREMVGNISIFIDDYFRMVLHLFSENHFYTIFQYLLQTRHSLKFTCNRNHLLQFFQSNKIHFNHLPAFRQQVSLL